MCLKSTNNVFSEVMLLPKAVFVLPWSVHSSVKIHVYLLGFIILVLAVVCLLDVETNLYTENKNVTLKPELHYLKCVTLSLLMVVFIMKVLKSIQFQSNNITVRILLTAGLLSVILYNVSTSCYVRYDLFNDKYINDIFNDNIS